MTICINQNVKKKKNSCLLRVSLILFDKIISNDHSCSNIVMPVGAILHLMVLTCILNYNFSPFNSR